MKPKIILWHDEDDIDIVFSGAQLVGVSAFFQNQHSSENREQAIVKSWNPK